MYSVFREKKLDEAVIPQNKNYGFLGTAGEQSHQLLSKAVSLIKKANEGNKAFPMSDAVISHFLDSRGGRHLAELMMDKADPEYIIKSLKKSISEFGKNYNPALFAESLEEEEQKKTGIFSSHPHKKGKSIGHIRKLMNEPLKAHEAIHKLGDHANDEKLHSTIKHFASQDPHVDVRPVVRKRMRELKVQGF